MTFEAQRISVRAQQLLILTAVRFVTRVATLAKGWLMMHGLLLQVADFGMAAGANVHGIGFGKAGFCAGMRAVAINAIAGLRSGMRHLGGFNQLRLVAVAGDAQCLGVALSENNLAVLRRSMASLAIAAGKRRMLKLRHQLWL